MSEDIKKETQFLGGGIGKNAATVTKERRKTAGDPTAREGRRLLRKTGDTVRPFGCDHIGSAAFHIYRLKNTPVDRPVHMVVCQTQVEECSEGEADFAHKQLQQALMEAFGREIPKLRNL